MKSEGKLVRLYNVEDKQYIAVRFLDYIKGDK